MTFSSGGSDQRWFRKDLKYVTPENLQKALKFVDSIGTYGGKRCTTTHLCYIYIYDIYIYIYIYIYCYIYTVIYIYILRMLITANRSLSSLKCLIVFLFCSKHRL